MIVLRDVLEIGLQHGDDLRLSSGLASLPVRRTETVVLDELLLALQHQLRETALLIGFDRLHFEQRRFLVVAILGHEGAVAVGGVRVALLLHIEIAQPRIQEIRVGPRFVAPHEFLNGLGTIEIGKGDGHHAKRVFHQFPVGAGQGIELDQGVGVALGNQYRIQHAGEGIQAALILALLEQRPAVLVKTLVVEAGGGTYLDDGLVSGLRLGVRLVREQDLAAPKLRFVDEMAVGVLRHQLIQGVERPVGLRVQFVGARQLVQHRIVALVFWIGLEQRRVQMDGFGGTQSLVGREFTFNAFGFPAFEIQVAQAAQRFGTQRGIPRIQIEKPLVALHRLGRIDILRRVGADIDLLVVEILDRRRFFRRSRQRRGTEQHRGQYGRAICHL